MSQNAVWGKKAVAQNMVEFIFTILLRMFFSWLYIQIWQIYAKSHEKKSPTDIQSNETCCIVTH